MHTNKEQLPHAGWLADGFKVCSETKDLHLTGVCWAGLLPEDDCNFVPPPAPVSCNYQH